MSADAASKVIALLLTAHDGCASCAAELLFGFGREFPEHWKLATDMYRLRHGRTIDA